MLNSPQQRAIFNTKNYMLLRHKDSYAAPLAKTVFSLPFVVICNSALQLTIRGYLQQCRNSTQEECQALERF